MYIIYFFIIPYDIINLVINMTIGIDIDDTLTNTRDNQEKYWQEYIIKYPKDGYTKELPETINDFGDEYVQLFWDEYREELAFNSSYKENASTILKKLKDEGHNLCIVTARRVSKCPELHDRIKKAFQENNIPIDTIYTDMTDKGLFCKENNIDVLIDDSLIHIKSALNNNVKGILFNKNDSYTGYKTTNWLEIYDIITKIKEEN